MRSFSHRTFHILAACAGLVLVCGILVTTMNGLKTPVARADAPTNIVGYAWSENIGWISFNCLNENVCASSNYGVTEDADGNLSGYAWSEHIGWISFTPTDVSGCPGGGGNCAPKFTSGAISGWAQTCAAFKNKNECDGVPGGYEDGSGGWKGWIHLAGNATDGSPYGITQNNDCTWSGWAWGEDPIGWIHFATTTGYGVRNTATGCNQVVVSIQASSTAISNPPQNDNLTWDSQNALSCVGSNFSTGAAKPVNGQVTVSVSSNTIFGVTCTGASGSASASVLVSVNTPYAALSLTAAPTSVQRGRETIVNWSAVNVTSCSVIGTNGFSANGTVGSQLSGPIVSSTKFTLTCQSDNGPISTETTVGIIPTIEEI